MLGKNQPHLSCWSRTCQSPSPTACTMPKSNEGQGDEEQGQKTRCKHPKAKPVLPGAWSNQIITILPCLSVNCHQLGGVGGSLSTGFWQDREKGQVLSTHKCCVKGMLWRFNSFRRDPVGVPPELTPSTCFLVFPFPVFWESCGLPSRQHGALHDEGRNFLHLC